MARGYFTGLFARPVILLFPGFCVLDAVAWSDIVSRTSLRPALRAAFGTAAFLLALPSILFDVAYVRGMQQIDPRATLRDDLKRWVGFATVQIAVHRSGGFFYTILSAIKSIKNRKIIVRLQGPKEPANFYIVALRTPDPPKKVAKSIRQVESSGKFRFLKEYATELRPFRIKLDLSTFPLAYLCAGALLGSSNTTLSPTSEKIHIPVSMLSHAAHV